MRFGVRAVGVRMSPGVGENGLLHTGHLLVRVNEMQNAGLQTLLAARRAEAEALQDQLQIINQHGPDQPLCRSTRGEGDGVVTQTWIYLNEVPKLPSTALAKAYVVHRSLLFYCCTQHYKHNHCAGQEPTINRLMRSKMQLLTLHLDLSAASLSAIAKRSRGESLAARNV